MFESFSVIFVSIVFEAVPFVLLGTLISSLIEEFVSQAWILDRIHDKKIRFYFLAGLMGLVMPVCECAIVPIMRRLIKKGVPAGIGVTFMMAVPIVNPVVLLSTSYAFYGEGMYVVARGLAGYVAAIIIGLLVQKSVAGKQILNMEDGQWLRVDGNLSLDAIDPTYEGERFFAIKDAILTEIEPYIDQYIFF